MQAAKNPFACMSRHLFACCVQSVPVSKVFCALCCRFLVATVLAAVNAAANLKSSVSQCLCRLSWIHAGSQSSSSRNSPDECCLQRPTRSLTSICQCVFPYAFLLSALPNNSSGAQYRHGVKAKSSNERQTVAVAADAMLLSRELSLRSI